MNDSAVPLTSLESIATETAPTGSLGYSPKIMR